MTSTETTKRETARAWIELAARYAAAAVDRPEHTGTLLHSASRLEAAARALTGAEPSALDTADLVAMANDAAEHGAAVLGWKGPGIAAPAAEPVYAAPARDYAAEHRAAARDADTPEDAERHNALAAIHERGVTELRERAEAYRPTTCANGADPESACGERGEALYALPGLATCGPCLARAAEEGGDALEAAMAAGDVATPERGADWDGAVLAVRFPGSHAPAGDLAPYHPEECERAVLGVLFLDSDGDACDAPADAEVLGDVLGQWSCADSTHERPAGLAYSPGHVRWDVRVTLPDGTEVGPFPFAWHGSRGLPEPGPVLGCVLADLAMAASCGWDAGQLAQDIDDDNVAETLESLRAIYHAAAAAPALADAVGCDAPPAREVPAFLAEPLAALRLALAARARLAELPARPGLTNTGAVYAWARLAEAHVEAADRVDAAARALADLYAEGGR